MNKPLIHIHLYCLLILICFCPVIKCNLDAKRLYDDLFSNYNHLVRPVINDSQLVKVQIKLKLSQLIEVNLKDQIMTTSMWILHYWQDQNLRWSPEDYNGIKFIHLESDKIWRPDIVLYNNAAADFEVVMATKAKLNYKGEIFWSPPAIYKSSCEIDVEWFPFDEQNCRMKYGSWTYDGFKVDLRHLDEQPNKAEVELGIDLSDFHPSVEWDIIEVPARRNTKFYLCCESPYLDLTFSVRIQRKTLFYTVNLILPCTGISFLTVLVFYLPSAAGEKISLSVSILVALTVFFLLLAETIPPTSLTIPFLGKYLLFTMLLAGLSICVTVIVLNINFRSGSTHQMSDWTRLIFLEVLPKFLCMKRPDYQFTSYTYFDQRNHRYSHQSNFDFLDQLPLTNYAAKSVNPNGLLKRQQDLDKYEPVCKLWNKRLKAKDKKKKFDKEEAKKIFSIGCENKLNEKNDSKKLAKTESLKMSKSSNKIVSKVNSLKNSDVKIQRESSQLSSTKPTCNHSKESNLSRNSSLKCLPRNDRIVPLSNYHPSVNSLRSVELDYREASNLIKKQKTIRTSFNSVQSSPCDDESLKNDEENIDDNSINDQNNNYFDNNQLGYQLDYRLDSGSETDPQDNQLKPEHYSHHHLNNKFDYSSNDHYTAKSIMVKRSVHGDDDECSVCSPIELIDQTNYMDDENQPNVHQNKNKYTDQCSTPNTVHCPNNKFIRSSVQYSPQQVRRQHSDSLITKQQRFRAIQLSKCPPEQANHFNRSIDQMLLNKTSISQPNNCSLKQQYSSSSSYHSLPGPPQSRKKQQTFRTLNESSINQVGRSIKRTTSVDDETIFLEAVQRIERNPHIMRAMRNVCFLAEHTRKNTQEEEIKEDWKYVALVLDRLFLWIFLIAVLFGSFSIILLDKQHPNDNKLAQLTAAMLGNKTSTAVNRIWSD